MSAPTAACVFQQSVEYAAARIWYHVETLATCLPPLCGRREVLRAALSQTRQPCDLPFCHQGALRIIAAITQAEVIRKILRHLKLAADPPPLAPARARQATFDWVA